MKPRDDNTHEAVDETARYRGTAERRRDASHTLSLSLFPPPAAPSSDIDSPRVGRRLKPHWRGFPDKNCYDDHREFRTATSNAEREFDKALN